MSSFGSRDYPNRKYSPTSDQFDFPSTELHPLNPRRPSSYEEMSGSDEYTPDGHHHQYEDPRLLARQIRNGPPPCKSEITVRPRKKENELYERCRSDSDGSENPSKRGCCRDVLCFMISLSFVFAVAALALVILVILGHLMPAKCGKCLNEVHPKVPVSGASTNYAHTEGMLKMIKELQGNLTTLHKMIKHQEHTIKELQDKELSHTRRFQELAHKPTNVYIRNAKYNVSQLRGSRGPPGPQGKQGPPGVDGKPGSGNISKCIYKVKQTKFSASPTSGHDVFASQPKGWVIISAACSSDGAAESNLIRNKLQGGIIQFSCRCRGISVSPTIRGSVTCFIHYWQCPAIG